MDEAEPLAANLMSMADQEPPVSAVREIVSRLQSGPTNPVARARLRVEQEVPVAQRGPGWDRHWRELEAYVELRGAWPLAAKGQSTDE